MHAHACTRGVYANMHVCLQVIAVFIDDLRAIKVKLTAVERRASRSSGTQRARFQLDSEEKASILKRISKDGTPRACNHPRAIV